MADFEGGSPPVFGNLGHLNLRKALPREIVSGAPQGLHARQPPSWPRVRG